MSNLSKIESIARSMRLKSATELSQMGAPFFRGYWGLLRAMLSNLTPARGMLGQRPVDKWQTKNGEESHTERIQND